MYDFSYKRASSVDEAAAILAADDFASPLSGGQTLLPVLRARLAMPTQLIDLADIDALKGISSDGDRITIGAMGTHAAVATNDLVQEHLPALAALAGGIGDPQVRHRGTIGGSIANNDPAACYPAAALALGAEIQTNKRSIAAEEFFTGMFSTALEAGEIIVAVRFPHCGSAHYAKHFNPASRFALVAVFAARLEDGLHVAVTGAGSGVFRWSEAENATRAGDLKSVNLTREHYTGDIHGSAEYRMQLTRVMAAQCFAAIGL
jgi:aerobic carbon-monoxide dehydrogenase medium subunit